MRYVLFILSLFTFVATGCSHNQTALVTIDFGIPVKNASVSQSQDSSAVSDAVANRSISSPNYSVSAIPGIDAIYIAACDSNYKKESVLVSQIFTVDTQVSGLASSEVVLEVPAGDSRKFLVYGVGNDGYGNQVVQYIGTTESDSAYVNGVTLLAGETTAIKISMNTPVLSGSYNLTGDYMFQPTSSVYDSGLNNWVENSFVIYGKNFDYPDQWVAYTGAIDSTVGPFSSNVNEIYVYGHSKIFGADSVLLYTSQPN